MMKKIFFACFLISILFSMSNEGVISYYAKQYNFKSCPLTIKWLDKALSSYSFGNSWATFNKNDPSTYPFRLNLEGLKNGIYTFFTISLIPDRNKDCSFFISKKAIFNQSCIYLSNYLAKEGFIFKGMLNKNISILSSKTSVTMFLTPIGANKCYVETQDEAYNMESFLKKHKNLLK